MPKRWIPGEIISASGLNQTSAFGVVQQPVPDLTVNVGPGSVILGGQVVTFSGGNSPSFSVPTSNPRIDLLVLTVSGTLTIIQGTESATPSAPTYPTNKFVICEVYNRPTQTCIKESSDGVNGYIYRDVRPFVGISIPVGTILPYAGSSAPSGFLLCDGSAVSRTTYATLFSVIGTTYGSGDGSTTFNLPNLKGRVPVGLDESQTEFTPLGKTGGSKYLQAHTHSTGYALSGSGGSSFYGQGTSGTTNITGSTGQGDSQNLQPYTVINYIIKY